MKRHERMWPGCVACAMLFVGVAGCGQSENVGWRDRDPPVGLGATAQAEAAAAGGVASDTARPDSRRLEYAELARALRSLRMRALGEPEIVALTDELNAALEAALAERSAFHRKLIDRKHEIERMVRDADAGKANLTQAQRDTLEYHYSNIEEELAPFRSSLFREPEYAHRLQTFQAALFAWMRELDPTRIPEIDRMEQLGAELFQELESMSTAAEQPGE